MEYRNLPHGGEKISVIGMGTSVVGEQAEKVIVDTIRYALDSGVNYIDLAGGHASIFSACGKALEGRRRDAMLQIHFGADYTTGAYGWSTRLETVKRSIDWQLTHLRPITSTLASSTAWTSREIWPPMRKTGCCNSCWI